MLKKGYRQEANHPALLGLFFNTVGILANDLYFYLIVTERFLMNCFVTAFWISLICNCEKDVSLLDYMMEVSASRADMTPLASDSQSSAIVTVSSTTLGSLFFS